MNESNSTSPSSNDIMSRADAVYSAMAMLAGMQLDVFSHLDDRPLDAAGLAGRLGVDKARLNRLLYALVNAELLTVADGRFSNAPLADHLLVRGKQGYMGSIHELWNDLWAATLKTAESVRSGRPAARHDFENMSQEEMGAFFRGLHAGAKGAGRVLSDAIEFTRFDRLLDVGGGSGGLAIGACETIPALKATVAELPQIVPLTRSFIREAQMDGRIDVTAVDFVSGTLSGQYDVAVLRYLLQTVSASDARAIIANVGHSIRPGGEIHILGWILEDSRVSPAQAVNFDIVFLNIYDGGAAFTVSEHEVWLKAAGFIDVTYRPAPSGCTPAGALLVSARKR